MTVPRARTPSKAEPTGPAELNDNLARQAADAWDAESADSEKQAPACAHIPEIHLLWAEGCPSTERAASELRKALEETGLGAAKVRRREIRTDDEARRTHFVGTPTILIDDVDLVPPAVDEPPARMACRVYRRRDGRVSPTPDPEDLREALRRAAARTEETK
ncbi:DF family (seleno)protein [Kribbella sp. CA-245084]|uniref:DF family (seleno)protein n=1 Tax=Kribbella sp. CA-245084 TaxID=3239940 RepID=UPI003D91904E